MPCSGGMQAGEDRDVGRPRQRHVHGRLRERAFGGEPVEVRRRHVRLP